MITLKCGIEISMNEIYAMMNTLKKYAYNTLECKRIQTWTTKMLEI